jgi:2'-5' RNA ligase
MIQGNKAYSRLFFALWPDEATRLELTRLIKTFDAQAGKPVPAHNFHVTLVFLGNVDQAMIVEIKQRAADVIVKPFALIFERVNYWLQPKVLCLTCNTVPQQIVDLASKLESVARQCGLKTDIRPYIPHITLARHAQVSPNQVIKPMVWCADAFCLVESINESEGVVYRVLQRWPLSKEAS